MKTVKEIHNGYELTISKEPYYQFKEGDRYYTTATKDGNNWFTSQRQRDLANKLIEPKYYLEGTGGKHLFISSKKL